MKIFTVPPNENWIVDRLTKEFSTHTIHQIVNNPNEADIIFLLAGWVINQIPENILKQKKVILTKHHFVPEKFNKQEFLYYDNFVTAYHTPNKHTTAFLKNKTKKPIIQLPYWIDSKFFFNKKVKRSSLGLPENKTIIGSFARDTEGKDCISPKLEKGPDILGDILERLDKEKFHVLLAGWRRQYIISRLEKMKMSYSYFEMHKDINELYNLSDFILIPSRHEGGPMALLEATLNLKTKILSTDVGLASEILHKDCICHNIDEFIHKMNNTTKDKWQQIIDYNHYKVLNYTISNLIPKYDQIIEEIYDKSV